MQTEGTEKKFTFDLSAEQIAYAKAHGGLVVTFDAAGVESTPGNPPDAVSFDGKSLGALQDGTNSFTIDATNLQPGQHAVTLSAGVLVYNPDGTVLNYDDFEYQNVQVNFAPTTA